MSNLTLGSLFDGSGGFPLGGLFHGILPVWAAEIEPYPIGVTTSRLPFVLHIGDVATVNGAEIEPVDIITFGSPCTNLSLAGRREGLKGAQSVLFYEAIRIIKEMRISTNGQYPKYAVWENVPGAFSSNKGEDFKAVLDAIIQICEPSAEVPPPDKGRWPYADIYLGDGWSVAYRTLNAQYFGVAQRRRRIYLVADLTGSRAGEILFEPEGVSRDFTSCAGPWQSAAGDPAHGPRAASECVTCLNDQGGSRMDVSTGLSATLRAEAHHPPCIIQAGGFCTEHSAQSRGIGFEDERAPTLRAGVVPGVAIENHPPDGRVKIREDGTVQTLTSRMGTGGGNVPLTLKVRCGCDGGGKGSLIQDDLSATISCNNDQTVFVPTVYGICSKDSNAMKSDNPHSGIYEAGTARTIDARGGNPACNQGGMAVVSVQGSMIGRDKRSGPNGPGVHEDVCFTLNTVDQHAVAYSMTTGSFGIVSDEQTSPLMARDYKDAPLVSQPYQSCVGTLAAGAHPSGFNGQDAYTDRLVPTTNGSEYVVRRLTPIECARLQGFPSRWGQLQPRDTFSDEEYVFWHEVRNKHASITGKAVREYTKAQMLSWYRKLHTDGAEYKLWGNGVALPCVRFVLCGIAAEEGC